MKYQCFPKFMLKIFGAETMLLSTCKLAYLALNLSKLLETSLA